MTNKVITPFYKANIHEGRPAAALCRAVPLLSVVLVTGLCLYGSVYESLVLLWTTAILSIGLWIYAVSTASKGIYASLFLLKDLECGANPKAQTVPYDMLHLVVLPNFKEDESILADTLRCLAEAEHSKSFWIILAMECREGEKGKAKAERLMKSFGSEFARMVISEHPENLVQCHQDGSQNAEVPGKSGNVKYALSQAYKLCTELGVHHDSVLVTVADADCLLHPLYFSRIGEEFDTLRRTDQHSWTMWCAPQFPYRNFYTSPIVSRVWGYVQSAYEFGGLTGAQWGSYQMVFSTYSLPLSLATDAEVFDGDVVAEDHHVSLKCFYYWLHNAMSKAPLKANEALLWEPTMPPLKLAPVFLPTKSTSVANEVYWKSWVDRWVQAKRHAQGVSELSYALLATYDACRTNRISQVSLLYRMAQVLMNLFCMHLLPILQGIAMAVLMMNWMASGRSLDYCPSKLWLFGDLNNWEVHERYLLCGMAGGWVLTWPIVFPWLLLMVSNTLTIYKCFLRPAMLNRSGSLWHSEDGKVPGEGCGLGVLTFKAWLLIFLDMVFGMSWILVPYGMLVELIAYVNVFINGNRSFIFVPANKGVPSAKLPSSYGTIDGMAIDITTDEPARQPIMIA